MEVKVADTFCKRLKGLMGKRDVDYGLLITPCKSVHTCFMFFAIDVLYLDRENKIIKIISGVKPWRTTPIVIEAHKVLEFPVHMNATETLYLGQIFDQG